MGWKVAVGIAVAAIVGMADGEPGTTATELDATVQLPGYFAVEVAQTAHLELGKHP